MADIQALIFWSGGVLHPALVEVISQVFTGMGRVNLNYYALPDFIHLIDDFALGKMNDSSFCRAVAENAGLDISPDELKEKIIEKIMPNPEVIQTIQSLPESRQRWLIVDYPRSWFDKMAARLEIFPCFSRKRLIFLSQMGLKCMIPDVFDHVVQLSQAPVNGCLWIDQNQKRCVQTLRAGMQSAIFVNARNLEREFILRRFIGKTQFNHQPSV